MDNIENLSKEELIERLKLADKMIEFATERLSYIAWCSNVLIVEDTRNLAHSRHSHMLRWHEKSNKAKLALKELEEINNGTFNISTGSSIPIDWSKHIL